MLHFLIAALIWSIDYSGPPVLGKGSWKDRLVGKLYTVKKFSDIKLSNSTIFRTDFSINMHRDATLVCRRT